ncbi:hypothetical protein FPZ12_044545 [Amycolatopsis acidicola]|uniref:Sensor domain-containing protein n=2 Tax=Amycolatopsis acidicola TaxID=2596893 RepID=A0A5N0UIS6_9PSEU|nr:hypothetical protein FPZ12_044545 [Amycolatopsis acidicola]
MVILAAVVLTGVTGCADRPNDLETYYEKTPGAATTTTPAASSAPASPAGQAAASSARSAVVDDVVAAVLTKQDLAGEGVRAATTQAENEACFAAVPSGDPRGASWTYSSGSTFKQQVTGYLAQPATDVLAQVQCDGQKLNVELPSGAQAVRGWCEGSTCTVLLAAGHVLSGLQVTASSASRAADAVKSLAPLAAKKLPSAQG